MEKIFDIQKIMSILPHRYPFIMIDRILELVPGEKVVALKNVTINEPFFQGHFPGNPIMPGVLMIEAMGQAGAVLAAESLAEKERGSLIYFMGMNKVKFRKPVVPGDQIICLRCPEWPLLMKNSWLKPNSWHLLEKSNDSCNGGYRFKGRAGR